MSIVNIAYLINLALIPLMIFWTPLNDPVRARILSGICLFLTILFAWEFSFFNPAFNAILSAYCAGGFWVASLFLERDK